jgi:hypothetical protein
LARRHEVLKRRTALSGEVEISPVLTGKKVGRGIGFFAFNQRLAVSKTIKALDR